MDQIKNFEITKVAYSSVDHAQKLSDQSDLFSNYSDFNGGQKKSVPMHKSKSGTNFH